MSAQTMAHQSASGYGIAVAVGAAFGGILFGYDNGVIAGAVNYLTTTFHLGSGMLGFMSGSVPLGAMLGCVLAGTLADRLGRRFVLFTAAILFIISSVGCAVAPGVGLLIVARLVSGVGVGMASTLVPVYISEVAPHRIRGTMVGGYQLATATGILIVYVVNAIIAGTHPQAWNETTGWRYMFLAGAVPGLIFLAILFFIPESPRFLVKVGRGDQAGRVLARLGADGDTDEQVSSEVHMIQTTIAEEGAGRKGFWGELLGKGFRLALLVGVVAAVFQQFTGVNAVNYYAPLIFKAAGAPTETALLQTVGVGFVKVLFVVVFMVIVDKIGRKRLLLWGGAGMAFCLFVIAWAFDRTPLTFGIDILIIAMIVLHQIFFELSWGGGAWVLISEIFPNRIRGRASSICSFMLWAATFAVTLMFPVMLSSLGNVWTYVVFGGFCVAMALFTHFFIYETAGKSLEQIQRDTAGATVGTAGDAAEDTAVPESGRGHGPELGSGSQKPDAPTTGPGPAGDAKPAPAPSKTQHVRKGL